MTAKEQADNYFDRGLCSLDRLIECGITDKDRIKYAMRMRERAETLVREVLIREVLNRD